MQRDTTAAHNTHLQDTTTKSGSINCIACKVLQALRMVQHMLAPEMVTDASRGWCVPEPSNSMLVLFMPSPTPAPKLLA